ncbi:PREDICTED: uncharacterized protein LOC101298106 [Fragaria vesca subsp. vesca]|uniref:uncharacterized protein LOC101298106 n=1 Tax=Fragaria vesca subsp. vesca TaxID=101020 RepID=UPI0002C354AB|nr:PREDICTED: uncharacterized protein LOC101298106 [Fragaria vesca subsp. vesca]
MREAAINIPTAAMRPSTNTKDSTSSPTCLKLLLYLLICMTIVLFILVPIVYTNLPDQTLEFQINSLSVSPFLVYSSSITANWNITLLARNPYKDKIVYYDAIEVSVFYHKLFLTSSHIAMNGSLYQSPKNESMLQVNLAISSVYMGNWMEAAAMLEEWRNRGVGFGVRAEAIVRLGDSEKNLKRKLSALINLPKGGSRNCWTLESRDGIVIFHLE